MESETEVVTWSSFFVVVLPKKLILGITEMRNTGVACSSPLPWRRILFDQVMELAFDGFSLLPCIGIRIRGAGATPLLWETSIY